MIVIVMVVMMMVQMIIVWVHVFRVFDCMWFLSVSISCHVLTSVIKERKRQGMNTKIKHHQSINLM